MIKDSGERTTFETGAQRDCQDGKGRMDLLPFRALMELSKVYEEGAKKYDANNWRRGIALSRYLDSGLRHLSKWAAGMRDEPHLEQAAWNIMCLIETQIMVNEGCLPESLNDLPYNELEISDNPHNIPTLKTDAPLDIKAWVKESSKEIGETSIIGEKDRKDCRYDCEDTINTGVRFAFKIPESSTATVSQRTKEALAKIASGEWKIPTKETLKESDYLPSIKEIATTQHEVPVLSDEDAMSAVVKEWPEHKGTYWAMKMKEALQDAVEGKGGIVDADAIKRGLQHVNPKTLKEWKEWEASSGDQETKESDDLDFPKTQKEVADTWHEAYEKSYPDNPDGLDIKE